VLDGGIHDDTFATFAARVKSLHKRTEFRRLPIDESVFAAYPKWSGNRRILVEDKHRNGFSHVRRRMVCR